MTYLALLTLAAKLALWILLLVFGIQTYRKFELWSLRWLAIYLVLSVPLGFMGALMMRQTIDSMNSERVLFGWTQGQFVGVWENWEALVSEVSLLILGVLLLSDIASLLLKAGAEIEGKLLSRLLVIHDRNTAWGISMLILMLSSPGITVALYLHYV